MKLIDIDPLKEQIDKEVKEGKVLDGWAFFFKAYLDNEPIINIVQCKNCKYYKNLSCIRRNYDIHDVCEDDFCSYGEYKGGLDD